MGTLVSRAPRATPAEILGPSRPLSRISVLGTEVFTGILAWSSLVARVDESTAVSGTSLSFIYFNLYTTRLQKTSFPSPLLKSSFSRSSENPVHSSICSCVSSHPRLQCLHCIRPVHCEDWFPFTSLISLDLFLNHILAFAVVCFAR